MPPKIEDRPDVQVFTEIGMIEHHLRASVSEHLLPGMTYTHFEVLSHFTRYGDGATPAELAQAMMMTKGAITAVLQRMEGLELVAVLADAADRRKKRVRLTRKGAQAYQTILKAMKPKTEALREGFTEQEFRAVLPFLRALNSFLQEISAPVEPAEPIP